MAMMERTDDGGFRFVFTPERRELEESLSYAMDRVLMERLPGAQRKFLRTGMLCLVGALLSGVALFLVRSESLLFSVMLTCTMLAGIYAYAYLRMTPRETMLREWKKQSIGLPDEEAVAYMLQQSVVAFFPDGINSDHPDGHHACLWQAIRSIEPTALGIAFQLRHSAVYLIPKRLFDDETSRDRFLETVRAWHAEACGGAEVDSSA